MTVVHIRESCPPKEGEAIEWLLTTLPVQSAKDAEYILKAYSLRWQIKDWHRILKSGCAVEKIALTKVERIKRAVIINAVIAWRLATLTLMGRNTPELAAEALFSECELAMLKDFARELGINFYSREKDAA